MHPVRHIAVTVALAATLATTAVHAAEPGAPSFASDRQVAAQQQRASSQTSTGWTQRCATIPRLSLARTLGRRMVVVPSPGHARMAAPSGRRTER